MSSHTPETVRDAISRRTMERITEIIEQLKAGGIDLADANARCVMLYEVNLPFLNPDIKQISTTIVSMLDEQLKETQNEAQSAHQYGGF